MLLLQKTLNIMMHSKGSRTANNIMDQRMKTIEKLDRAYIHDGTVAKITLPTP